jgi:hypothetical protein
MTTSSDRPLVLDIHRSGRYKNHHPPRNGRTVPLKLLCLGLSRTGTQSLREALFLLGYDDIYHQTTINVDLPADASTWIKALRAKFEGIGKPFGRHEFDKLLGHCMAVTDVPCVTFWQELMDAYPEAKVVLTVRDSADVWYESVMQTIMNLLGTLYGNTWMGFLQRKLLYQSPSDTFAKLLLRYDSAYSTCFRDFHDGTSDGIAVYKEHNDAVKRYATSQGRTVLEYNVKEGWKPLVRFLSVHEPSHPFPKLNDKTYFRTGTRKIQALLLLGVTIQTLVIGAAAVVLSMLLNWWLHGR